jgi:hypothetical protein
LTAPVGQSLGSEKAREQASARRSAAADSAAPVASNGSRRALLGEEIASATRASRPGASSATQA